MNSFRIKEMDNESKKIQKNNHIKNKIIYDINDTMKLLKNI